jgi:three-Cys-motif partner protein
MGNCGHRCPTFAGPLLVPRDLPDSDPRKWVYTAHARAKHAIQRTYLGAWLAILGRHFSPLILFDGFAGRGRYEGNEEGSPLLFFNRAAEAVDRGRATEVQIRCVELDHENLENLQTVISGLRHTGVSIDARCGAFSEEALRSAAKLGTWERIPPVFWTADPFGFRGVPLSTIRILMALPRSEVLLTFMVRDMRRFLAEPNHQVPMTEFFGGEAWRKCLDLEAGDDRERCLLLTYSALVRDGIAKFATPFRVFEDERRQTLYYLIHLTNNGLGMRQMKRAMIKESKDMTFWPVTVRPPDQLALDVEEVAPYPSLQTHLAESYIGRTMTFEELLNTGYPEGLWLEPEYRAALLAMEDRESVIVTRTRSTPTGRAPRGLQEPDKIAFSGQASLI